MSGLATLNSRRPVAYAVALLAALVLMRATPSRAETFLVATPDRVGDAALRNREFSEWNFGGGILLEAGFMPGLYEEHRCGSLVRFDLAGLPCRNIHLAKFRLYKPRCSVQMNPVRIEVYEVAPANSDWAEGTGIAEVEDQGCSWRRLSKGKAWAGGDGCARGGTDYLVPLLDVQTAPLNGRQWMEFTIPPALVQRWLDHPEQNAGLYIKAENNGNEWGDHVFFFSSEHSSGQGPQLVLEGTRGEPRPVGKSEPRPKRRDRFPPDEAAFDKWLAAADNRYVRWTQAARMTRQQAMSFYYYDITVSGEMLLPNCRVPLTQYVIQLDALMPKGDEQEIRQVLRQTRERLLYWEYIREVYWYDSGPLADALSPLQLGILWGEEIFGSMNQEYGDTSWKSLTPEQLDKTVRETVTSTRQRLKLTPEKAAIVDPLVEKYERLEHQYVERFIQDLKKVRQMVEAGNDGDDMLDAVRRMHLNHELFLYYQSTFNTPRWSVFMEHGQVVALAKMFNDARRKEYNPARTARQVEQAAQFRSVRAAPDGSFDTDGGMSETPRPSGPPLPSGTSNRPVRVRQP